MRAGNTSCKLIVPFVNQENMHEDGLGIFRCPSSKIVTLDVNAEAKDEIAYNLSVFSELGVIRRFQGFWPSLQDLHFWI